MHRTLVPVLATIGVVALLAVYVLLDIIDVVPGILTNRPARPAGLALMRVADARPAPVPAPAVSPAPPNLERAKVQAQVDALVARVTQGAPGQQPAQPQDQPAPAPPAVIPNLSVAVLDQLSGQTLGAYQPERALTAASSTKIPTAIAALTQLGPTHMFSTRTVLSGQTVTLVGEGDQLLAANAGDPAQVRGHAGLGDLARATAAQLRQRGVSNVTVAFDDTSYGDQAPLPDWVQNGNQRYAGKTSPLAINTGLARPNTTYGYVADSAAAAARSFTDRLREAGVSIAAGPQRQAAPADAVLLAKVDAAPLADVVRVMLKDSDNVLADGLCRALARHLKRPPTFAGGVQAVHQALDALKLPTRGLANQDCSGLSTGGKVSAEVLAQGMRYALSGENDSLKSIASSLPVAALDGTMHDRLLRSGAAGVARAKTGSLNRARSLTGFVTTKSGRILTYAVVIADYGDGQGGRAKHDIDLLVEGLRGL